MEKLTYGNSNNWTKVTNKATRLKNQKSVASELITALSKPKIKVEVKEEIFEEETKIQDSVHNDKSEHQDFQAALAKNLKSVVEKEKKTNTMVKLSNKTKSSKASKNAAIKAGNGSVKEDDAAAFKNKVNTDWISFLKKRQDSEPLVDDDVLVAEIDDSPKSIKTHQQQKPKRVKNVRKEVSGQTIPPEKESDVDKDKILQGLMKQVADLEASMGANISKLELQLKEEKEKTARSTFLVQNLAEEKEKNNSLEAALETEREKSSDMATKLISIQQTKLAAEQLHEKKLDEVREKLKSEKSKCGNLARELTKAEKKIKDEVKLKEQLLKDVSSISSENEKLKLKSENLRKWKEESIIKIKTSIINCQKEHVLKIKELEQADAIKCDLLVEISSRIALIISESSSKLNAKNKDIESLKLRLVEQENRVKEKDRMLKEFELKLKEKESKCKEIEESEARYKEKVDRYRVKEERYREKERKIKDREEKLTEHEKRLREKEQKYNGNDEKLKQKEEEMFRVYELVNQLQQRMRNDKINPVVNGQDILSLGNAEYSPVAATSDEDICILPTPVRVSERLNDLQSVKDDDSKESYSNNNKSRKGDKDTSDRKSDKRNGNDPRQKERIRESHSTKSFKNIDITEEPNNISKYRSRGKVHSNSPVFPEGSPKCQPKGKEQKESRADKRSSSRNSPKGSGVVSSNTGLKSSIPERELSPKSENREIKERSSQLIPSLDTDSVVLNANGTQVLREESRIPAFPDTNILVKTDAVIQKEIPRENEEVSDCSESSRGKTEAPIAASSSVKLVDTAPKSADSSLKRKCENFDPEIQKPTKKPRVPSFMVEEEVLLIEDEEDDDIQCVMEIKTSPSVTPPVEVESIRKGRLEDELSKGNTKVNEEVSNKDDDKIEDLPEPVPCIEMSERCSDKNIQILKTASTSSRSPNAARMKAADFFEDFSSVIDDEVDSKETELNVNPGGLELEHWISEQLRLERCKIEKYNSSSDSNDESLEEDLESDQSENLSKPFYINPDISWVLQKWPNMSPSPELKSGTPRAILSSDCEVMLTSKSKVPKAGPDSINQKSSRNLMLPYLWPMATYVKRDLMSSFDTKSPLKTSESSSFKSEPMCSSQLKVTELHEGKADEVTIGLLYDDLEPITPVDITDRSSYSHDMFSTKRSWDEMRVRNLSEERNRIIEELKNELDRSRSSDLSSTDEKIPFLVVNLQEPLEENPLKRTRISSTSVDEEDEKEIIVTDLIEEFLDTVTSRSDVEDHYACNIAWSDDDFDYECFYPWQTSLAGELTKKEHFNSDNDNIQVRKTGLQIFKPGRNYRMKHAGKRSRGIVRRYKRRFGRSL